MKTLEKLRISYVGFFHETNTYLTEGMGETTLDRMRTFRGDQIKKGLKESGHDGEFSTARLFWSTVSAVEEFTLFYDPEKNLALI